MADTKTKAPMINANFLIEKMMEVMTLEDCIYNIQKFALKAETLNADQAYGGQNRKEEIRKIADNVFEILSAVKTIEYHMK